MCGNIFIAYHFKGIVGKEVLGKGKLQNVLHINMYFFSTLHAFLCLSCKSKGSGFREGISKTTLSSEMQLAAKRIY